MILRKNVILFALLFSAPLARADISLLPEISRSVPDPHDIESWKAPVNLVQDALSFLDVFKGKKRQSVEVLANELKRQFEYFRGIAKPNSCNEASASDYVLSLRIAGKHTECANYARECAATLSSPAMLVTGALCDADRYKFSSATQLFEESTHPRFSKSSDYRQAVLEFAMFEMYGLGPEKVNEILSLEPTWNEDQRAKWKSVLQRSGDQDTGKFTKKEVDDFLESQINVQTKSFKQLLLSLKIGIQARDDHLREAFDTLQAHASELHDPLQWYYNAYLIVYKGFGPDFTLARILYDTYDLYSNPWTKFPFEHNTYNYTEIYEKACASTLLQGVELSRFQQIKAKLRNGELDLDAAFSQIQELMQKHPDKADLLVAYAGILSLNGKHEEAFSHYWKAHRACRYFNRANWGLVLEKRFFMYSAMPEYAANERHVKQVVKGMRVPEVVKQYYLNWNSLNESLKERVIYAARIWTPYYATLYYATLASGDNRSYIKFAFDLLSESPGREGIANERIGGENYPNDNRLWDDVRGVGGKYVVADANEVSNAVHGDYNLLTHEIAHQFHRFLEEAKHRGAACIENHYARTKKTGKFPNAYAAMNSSEHFAEGVTYASVSREAPPRYGTNRSWLEKNDPVQLEFIKKIEAGNLEQIYCNESRR